MSEERFSSAAPLPDRIHRLHELALDLWWSWDKRAREVFRRLDYEHPLFTQAAISAQSRITELHQAANITHRHYCGAWQRYGFHEDGIWSAHRLCAEILNRDPWT